MTLASDALAIARAGVRAVAPRTAVRRALSVRGDRILLEGRPMPMGASGKVHLLAFGKAAVAMEAATRELLGARCAGGLTVVREGDEPPGDGSEVRFGEHPIPGPGSVRAARDVLGYASGCPEEDTVLFLVSGGASSILEAPWEGVTLAELQRTTRALLACGAPIQSMNVLRRHLSTVKGGRLALATRARRFATLAISDVVGDPPYDVGSGPTVPDPSTYGDAIRIIARYGLGGRLPAAVLRHLHAGAQGEVPETPKPGTPKLAEAPFVFVASNRIALDACASEARHRGYSPHLLSREVVGETRDVGRLHGAILAAWSTSEPGGRRPTCLLSAGETTVTLGPQAGRGGRNQEFALAASGPLAGHRGVLLLSLGTDGIDGPTDAAGGRVDGRTVSAALRQGIDVEAVLDRHASYDALRRLGGLIVTGPTGTNVMDLHVGLSRPSGTAGSSPRSGARPSRRRRS